MKTLLLAAVAMLSAPAAAFGQATLTVRDVPLHGARVLQSSRAPRFNMVGLHWQGGGSVAFRTRSARARWSPWRPAAPEAEDAPDRPTQPAWHLGNPYWTGDSTAIAYRVRGRVSRLRAYFVESPVDDLPPRRLSIAGSPPIIGRLAWGADEAIRRAPPLYAPAVRFALVHHTAGTNSYSPQQSAAIVRGIEIYHVRGNGWNDIGYNFLVDKYGQVFEGRYGGVDKNVVGAHAEGFNTGSVGVAVIGTYTDAAPPAVAQRALADLLAWRLDIAHVDPLSTLTVSSGGNPRYPVGVPVFLHAISGHRDTGFTTCPGDALYARLGAIARAAAATGLPKLYAPTVRGALGGTVEFHATLTEPLAWTITVRDAAGQTVAGTTGAGTDVTWQWDATQVPPGKYAWTISAGTSVRPATGSIGAAAVPLALRSSRATPAAISPNGDGIADRTTISYTLTTAATVIADLRRSDGRDLGTVFNEQGAAGKHSFEFTGDAIADGRYAITLTATDGKTTAVVTIPLVVDRTLSRPFVRPAAFSPNGDGRDDAASLAFTLSRAATVRVDVRQASRNVTTLLDGSEQSGNQRVTWDGTAAGTRVRDGAYLFAITVTSPFGKTNYLGPVRVDTVRPRLTALSLSRRIFRLSEPSLVTLKAGRRLYRRSFRAGVFRFAVPRLPRRYRIFATDAAGNVSRTLRAR
jgi:hypothetical protein